MANADCPFFYTARSYGVNKVILNLVAYPDLEWRGRQAVIAAEAEQEALRLYGLDMIWMIVKSKYKGEFPQPSKIIIHGYNKRKELRTTEEITQYILDKINALPDEAKGVKW